MSKPVEPSLHIPNQLIEHINRGDCVLFIGDALDATTTLSTRLASALVDACDAHCEFCQTDCKCSRPDSCVVPLTRAAQLYESHTNRQELIDFVIRRIANASQPTAFHHTLVKLPVRIVITTVYHDCLETALHVAGRPHLSVVNDEDIPFDDPERVQLIRLHGTISQPKSLVLTEDDVDDLFGRLPIVTKILQAHFACKTLLFVGYRLCDPHFRALYRQVTSPIERYKRLAYAVQWPPDAQATRRWNGKITIIDAEPLPFLNQLVECTHAQMTGAKHIPLPSEPYKFLDYYTAKDVAVFFGRDLETDLLLSTILTRQLSVLYGRSGTGKTSLLLARVGPELEKAGYHVVYVRVLEDPSAEVRAAVRGVRVDQLETYDLDRQLYDVLIESLPTIGRLVIILDQFEELFLRQSENVRQMFMQELANCLEPPSIQPVIDLRIVLSLRDDYLGALDELSTILSQDVFRYRYKLENLTRDKALKAILGPAEAFGLPIDASLREQLITDLEDRGLETANIQIVLYRLYRDAIEQGLWSESQRRGIGLTSMRYHALGKTNQILAGYLDNVLDELPTVELREGARAVLKSMVTAQQTRIAVSRQYITRDDRVRKVGLADRQLDELLAYLREKRVVRKFGDEDRYELAHQVMVGKVWTWVGDRERWLLDIRDMLRREISNYQKFHYLLSKEKLELLSSCGDELAFSEDEVELLFRSALAARHNIVYWRERAIAVTGRVECELLDNLSSSNLKQVDQAISGLGVLDSPLVVDQLSEWVEADFVGKPEVWVDHEGREHRVSQTVLNLNTLRQQRAILVLIKMSLPVAAEVLSRWTPPGMSFVPAGFFTMGSMEYNDEWPVHEIWLDAFWIDRCPATNAQWAAFMQGGGYQQRKLWTESGWIWIEKKEKSHEPCEWKIKKHRPDHPVVGITWYEAVAFAHWSGKNLLSEAQWEKASRGVDGRVYPWGDDFDLRKCNTRESKIHDTTPVGEFSPAGDSPCEAFDMAGNVWEWCRNLYIPYQYKPADGRERLEGSGSRVLRGGSWSFGQDTARCASRFSIRPEKAQNDYGLRCGVYFTLDCSS